LTAGNNTAVHISTEFVRVCLDGIDGGHALGSVSPRPGSFSGVVPLHAGYGADETVFLIHDFIGTVRGAEVNLPVCFAHVYVVDTPNQSVTGPWLVPLPEHCLVQPSLHDHGNGVFNVALFGTDVVNRFFHHESQLLCHIFVIDLHLWGQYV
tara:strand:- start:1375 stop:1830 length:456 start_codon:yes stop_codon:yes gene_type:complete